jgi:hypothetical protein
VPFFACHAKHHGTALIAATADGSRRGASTRNMCA